MNVGQWGGKKERKKERKEGSGGGRGGSQRRRKEEAGLGPEMREKRFRERKIRGGSRM